MPAVSLSYVGLARRVKKLGEWKIADKFPTGQAVFLDSGAYSLNRADADIDAILAKTAYGSVEELAAGYMEFVTENLPRLDMVSEFDALCLGQEWRSIARAEVWSGIGEKFLPIWHAEDGVEELARLAAQYPRVGVLQADTEADYTALLNAAAATGTLLHGVAMTQMDAMRRVRWDSVGSTSWLSPTQYGDTFVWTGKELKRYPKRYKDNARRRHRTLFSSDPPAGPGLSAEKIAADDTTEVLKLSIWSWTEFVADIERRHAVGEALEPILDAANGVTPDPDLHDDRNVERSGQGVGLTTPAGRNEELVPEPRERMLLPILSVTETPLKEGEEGGATEPRIGVRESNLMQCSTCYMKGKCPQYRPGSECAFDIPVAVTTTTQVRALRKAILAMQGQRVAMMRMIEQVEGGYADQNTSLEIQRLWKMMRDDAEADSDRSSFEIKVSGDGNSNFISRVFGGEVADRVTALEAPVPARDILQDFRIVDAEVVEEVPARRVAE